MENVFLQRRVADDGVEVVVAKRGEQVESEDPDVRFLVLHDGRRYEGVPGTTQISRRRICRARHPVPLPSLAVSKLPRRDAVRQSAAIDRPRTYC